MPNSLRSLRFETVCVTGAAGFVGSHIVQRLLEAGHTVHATVRNAEDATKTAHLRRLPGAEERLKLYTADVTRAGALREALAGADALVHAAAAVRLRASDPQREIVDIAVNGTRFALDAALASGSVRRVILTSSVSAIVGYDKSRDYVFTEQDYCLDATLRSNPYGLGKTRSEQLFWGFIERHPELEGQSINPALVLGPLLAQHHKSASVTVVRDILNRALPGCPPLWFGLVHAHDVAEAHWRALQHEQSGHRHILMNGGMWWREMAEALSAEYVVRTGELPRFLVYLSMLFDRRVSLPVLKPLLGFSFQTDNSATEERLGLTHRAPKDALFDTARSLVEHGVAQPRRVR